MKNDLKDVLRIIMEKRAFEPPMPATPPPPDPSMAGGAPPMDPSMAGGAPPPQAPAMAPPPPQAPAGGAPAPMAPPAGGQAPASQMDPAMIQQMQQAMSDPNVQAMLQQIGIIVDPQQGPVDQQTGQVIPPEVMMQILQQLMQQAMAAQQPQAGGAPPVPGPAAGGVPQPMPKGAAEMAPPPMDPAMSGGTPAPMAPQVPPADPMVDIETRLAALEEQVGELAAKMESNPDATQQVADEGLSDEAQQALNGNEEAPLNEMASQQKMAEEEEIAPPKATELETPENAAEVKPVVGDPDPEKASDVNEPPKGTPPVFDKKSSERRQPDPARRLSGLISRLRSAF